MDKQASKSTKLDVFKDVKLQVLGPSFWDAAGEVLGSMASAAQGFLPVSVYPADTPQGVYTCKSDLLEVLEGSYTNSSSSSTMHDHADGGGSRSNDIESSLLQLDDQEIIFTLMLES
eukprot:CAMPEP_0114407706 /NCGR_PEP_ID=MMETSP0102-20121206/22120_1 /TAXON_ID=38822 ORGANISM="Pteridomonas danica, Strain PT" /NCGR_SAMPLE_ID=MMETSP0102 /ASSEMBLY_ACC=CAM_ASM_000212 /LENGTH=116 /DNA_ID=CAMNT_0001574261 /DNA_START=123 /DNA_END=476 /DNA_ORIENTATION=+